MEFILSSSMKGDSNKGKNNLKFKNWNSELNLEITTKIKIGNDKTLNNLKILFALGTKFSLLPFSSNINIINDIRIKTPDTTIPLLYIAGTKDNKFPKDQTKIAIHKDPLTIELFNFARTPKRAQG